MKKILAILSLFSATCLLAQDYAFFPEDSLFFESESPDDVLMPLVKSSDAQNLIYKVNTIPTWDKLSINNTIEWENYGETLELPIYSWLGKCFQEEEKHYFVSAQGDSIYIDTSIALGESYAIPLEEHYTDLGEVKYLNVIFYDFFETETGDSIKEYRFIFLDELMAPVSFGYDPSLPVEHHLDGHVFQLSKNRGVVASPAFYYFPYGKQYTRKAKISDLLDSSASYAYQTFHKNVGDELHTELYDANYFGNYSKRSEKKVCTAQEYDESNNAFYTTYDLWTRYKDYLSEDDELVFSYNQFKDTVYFNDFQSLNKIVPNGFGEDDLTENGYFYKDNDQTFVEDKTDQPGFYDLVNDSIHYSNPAGTTSAVAKNYYRLSLGGLFFDYHNHISFGHKKIVYYNANGEEWGDAFTDAYILDIEDQESKDLYIFYENGRLYLDGTHSFENASIYDMNGRLISSFGAEKLSEGMSILDMHSGAYLLNLWNNSDRKGFKFIK